jgi:hypothetical protein
LVSNLSEAVERDVQQLQIDARKAAGSSEARKPGATNKLTLIELPVLPQIDRDFVEQGRAKNITTTDRVYRVEAHRAHDIPCRHLAAVLVAGVAL